MLKIYLTSFFLNIACFISAQVKISTYTYKQKEYKVYPFRFNESPVVPPVGFEIPDGDYVVFREYEFSRDYKNKKINLLDTTEINAFITIKNNKVEGQATFFDYYWKFFKSYWSTSFIANYKNGVLDGLLSKYNYGKLTGTEEYKNGILNGYEKNYYSNGNISSIRKHYNGEEVDTVIYYYQNGKIREIYDLDLENSTLSSSIYLSAISNYSSEINRLGSMLSSHYENSKCVKSFYKHYSQKGFLTLSFKVENNNIVPLDTFYNYNRSTMYIISPHADGYSLHSKPLKKSRKWAEITVDHKLEITKTIRQKYTKRKGLLSNSEITKFDLKNADPKEKKPLLLKAYHYKDYRKPIERHDSAFLVPFYDLHLETYDEFLYSSKKESDSRNLDYIIDTLSNSVTKIKHFLSRPIYIKTNEEIFYNEDGNPIIDTTEKNPFLHWDYLFPDTEIEGLTNKASFKQNSRAKRRYEQDTNYVYDKTKVKKNQTQKIYVQNIAYNGKIKIVGRGDARYDKKKEQLFLRTWDLISRNEWDFDAAEGQLKNHVFEGNLCFATEINRWNYRLSKKKSISEDFYSKKPLHGNLYMVNYESGKANGALTQYNVIDTIVRFSKKGNWLPPRKEDCVVFKETSATFSNGELNGALTRFNRFGDTVLLANFTNGLLNGPFYKRNDSTLILSGAAKMGKLNGPFSVYNSGRKSMEATFVDNELNGKLIRYDNRSSAKYLEIETKMGNILRKTIYFPNGKTKENINFSDSSRLSMNVQLLSSEVLFDNKIRLKRSKGEGYEADYVSYYESGDTLSYGKVVNNKPVGVWKFYNNNRTLINLVEFKDSLLWYTAVDSTKKKSIGNITSYYNSGRIRCMGFLTGFSMSYNCSEHQDMTNFDIYYSDFFDPFGKQTCSKGNGEFIVYNEKAMKTAEAKQVSFRKTGAWKYFDENLKLHEVGIFENDLKQGVWYKGDLEGLNFEDNACFFKNPRNNYLTSLHSPSHHHTTFLNLVCRIKDCLRLSNLHS
jgi:antitoxin component YwqK of YwqJK toxin-antitoxin module